MTRLGRLRHWWRNRGRTDIDVPGGILSYTGHLNEAQVARIRAAFLAAVDKGGPPTVLR